jgi:hypothetical protein
MLKGMRKINGKFMPIKVALRSRLDELHLSAKTTSTDAYF